MDEYGNQDPSEMITAENLRSAYKTMFGTEAPEDWVQKTQAAYDPTNTLSHVMYNAAVGRAADTTPFQNAPGAQSGFTSGADYYQKQGYTPGGYTYEGIPTEYYDKNGNLVASYGVLQEAGGQPKSTASNAWRWNEAASTPQGYETSRAIPRTDWNSALREGLTGAAFALSPVAAGAGLSAMGALGAGSAMGEGLTGLTAMEAGLGGEGLAGMTAAELGSSLGGAEAATAGLTLSDLLKYGQYGLKGLGALQSLAGLSELAGGKGLPLGISGQGGTGQGGQTTVINPTGPWNTFLKPGLETIGVANQKPISVGLENLEMLSDTMPQQSYFTYGSPAQTTYPIAQGYKKGGALKSTIVDGKEHVPEFITGATGHYVKGRGDGQSDDIPAMLADGEYVFDADTVAQLGNGSSDAGAKVLDKMREALREHKRSAPVHEIPPKAKSPLEYIKEGMKRK